MTVTPNTPVPRGPGRAWLGGVLTHHPVAKIFSLSFALLLVFLIDRELMEDLYDDPVAVVANASAGERNRIWVDADLPYVVLIEPGTPLATSLVIRGRAKEAVELSRRWPIRAKFPKERLDTVFRAPRENEVHKIALESGDLDIRGFDASRIALDPLRVPVARQTTKKVLLTTRTGGPDTVTFSPSAVTVVGPVPFLLGGKRDDVSIPPLTRIELDVTEEMTTEQLRDAIDRWLKGRPGGAFLGLASGEAPAVTIDRGQVQYAEVDLKVTVVWISDGRFEYALSPQNPSLRTSTRQFLLPAALLPNLPRSQLEGQLQVYANVTRRPTAKAIEDQKAGAPVDKPDEWWVADNAQLEFGPEAKKLLDKHKLRLKPDQPLVEFHARVRPSAKK